MEEHKKRAEKLIDKLADINTDNTNLNRTQKFFVEAFQKDLSDDDFKAIKQLIKEYYAKKLEKSLSNKK